MQQVTEPSLYVKEKLGIPDNEKVPRNMSSIVNIKDTTANPAPLGLLAFGMTTILLNLHNAGFFTMDTMILSMGIFYGGIAQIIAGIMEWKKIIRLV
jgi:succinate-acetate transporter protein